MTRINIICFFGMNVSYTQMKKYNDNLSLTFRQYYLNPNLNNAQLGLPDKGRVQSKGWLSAM